MGFKFIDQFALRTLLLMDSQYTQILGLITAPLLTLLTLPFLGLHRLMMLPGTVIQGALDGLFAGLLDAPLAFGNSIHYWSQMIPILFSLPLKLLTSPFLFVRGYLGSLFVCSPAKAGA